VASDLLTAGGGADVCGAELNVRLRDTTELGVIADDDRDLPGEDLRTSHANDVGLNMHHINNCTHHYLHHSCAGTAYLQHRVCSGITS